MKKYLFLFLLAASFSYTQDRGLGVGAMLGEPTGVSLKAWTNANNAIDAGLAWSYYKSPSLHLHADYLWHSFDVIKTNERIPIYYGVGGRLKFGKKDDSNLGVRGVFGVGYFLKSAPVDFFIEIAPILDLIPGTGFSMNGGIGARYFFE